LGEAYPGFGHGDMHDERHQERRCRKRLELLLGRICHGEEGRNEDQAHRGDGERYGERPDHPLPVQAIRLARTWTKPLIRAKRKKVPKRPMYTFSIQPEKGMTNLMNRAVAPTRPIETSALPTQRVAEVPGPDSPDELKRCQRQVDVAQDHVQRHDGRVLEEAGVVRLVEVVGGRRRDAHERKEAHRRHQGPPHGLYHRSAPFLRSSSRAILEDHTTPRTTLFVSRDQAGGIGRRVDRGVEYNGSPGR
jgi:hypothetical protein